MNASFNAVNAANPAHESPSPRQPAASSSRPVAQHLLAFVDRIQAAANQQTALRIRGGGSKDFYGHALQGEAFDTAALNGVVSYEPSELVVTVRAGTPLADLEAALAEKGQCLPFEPPHFGGPFGRATGGTLAGNGPTVGGMVASGLSGPARATAGGVRDFVLGLELINGRAEVLRFGGTVMKNVAGYDVSRLMVGAMGTLGLITEVSLKVLPVAPAEATLRFTLDEASAIRQLNTWAGQPLPLNASSWVVDAGMPSLYLRLRGAVAAVESACTTFTAQHGGVRVDSPETRADWRAARDLQLPWFTAGFARGDALWRISVPGTTGPLNLGDTLIDWLGGQRWLWVANGDSSLPERVMDAAQGAGGHAIEFRAATKLPPALGQTPLRQHSARPLPPALQQIHQRLKNEFDPSNIFNRGRLFANH